MSKENCDCIKKVAENIKTKVLADEAQKHNGFAIVSADWEHQSWFPQVRLYLNFIIKSTFTKKDGTTSKPRNGHVSIFFSYCPFCGKSIKKEDDHEL